ncbi:hypothetical protein AYI70_g8547, partial [Smittium culicis]
MPTTPKSVNPSRPTLLKK